jgi:hypothetical protein
MEPTALALPCPPLVEGFVSEASNPMIDEPFRQGAFHNRELCQIFKVQALRLNPDITAKLTHRNPSNHNCSSVLAASNDGDGIGDCICQEP